MELSVVRKVAQFINEIRAVPRKEREKGGEVEVSRGPKLDAVDISDRGNEAAQVADYVRNLATDPGRAEAVSRLREAVNKGGYKMTEEMVENIAEKIARSLA